MQAQAAEILSRVAEVQLASSLSLAHSLSLSLSLALSLPLSLSLACAWRKSSWQSFLQVNLILERAYKGVYN